MDTLIKAPERKPLPLILHCGAVKVDVQELRNVKTPENTKTWYPLPHHELVENTRRCLTTDGIEIVDEVHALTRDGDRYFGIMAVRNPRAQVHQDYEWMVALRNANDRAFSAGLAFGSRVFTCDNLAFSGEIMIARKHTRHAALDLPRLITRAAGDLNASWIGMDNRIQQYKDREITDTLAHDTIIRALDAKVICGQDVKHVLQEWRHPSHEAFAPRTAWSLFNAHTEVLKDTNMQDLPKRTRSLHGVIDAQIGLSA
jgi:hypothetical protein